MSEIVEYIEIARRELGGAWTIVDRIAGCDLPVTDGVDTYRSVAVSRDDISSSPTDDREELTIVLPASDAVGQLFLPRSGDFPLRVTVYRGTAITRSATGITATTSHIVYQGEVAGAKFGGSLCELKLRPAHRLLDQVGPKQRFSRQCRHPLYGPGCTVDESLFATIGTAVVSGSAGAPLNYDDYVFSTVFGTLTNGYLAGGTIVLNGQHVRQISMHSATATGTPAQPWVRLVSPFPVAVADGDAITVYPGCKHTSDDCLNKFNNIDNFGGLARVARSNPFISPLTKGPR